ncbi:radical SAM protein [Clostridium perfringens]|uniref:radical SAM protein n=1 Tax=Clostridium perfringens TaxID=1502 RepID=UPI0018E48719|nr:radical SAM protein [Clostridium perfringens]MBI6042298.1 radical SAM protein [Clostridium perfringens]MDH5084134.1 Radical SAM superfamily protein [Clostridium perfringens]MDK0754890.1 radical SAM protein [Clostridium perfringens]MDK0756660.1 radical SAM protein [Clostridium perfringens]MDK0904912.1 radical SAM protein [Clostridium perfringens]
MDKIKRIILFNIPMSICNFRCSYCYLSHRDECYQNKQIEPIYSPKHIAKALSPERLGGLAYINFCAEGETLLAKDIEKYIYELAKEGHYIEIVTNATISNVIEKILSWDKEILKRIEFKCSFHYLELKKKNLLDVFSNNVKRIWEAGSSANIEITPSDELIKYIDEVKSFSMENFGALPHLTIARNDKTDEIDYLTNLSIEEYDKVWSQFNSDFWKFKKTIFKKERNEFCYAGDWLLQVDFITGNTNQCYRGRHKHNIFENVDKDIEFKAIGKCMEPHCYNGHMLLTLGCIPNLTKVGYGDIRNRVKVDGKEWLQPEIKNFFNSKLYDNNKEYSKNKKLIIMSEASLYDLARKGKVILRKILK